MASTPTTNLRLELMATGENDNTWGTKMNTNLQLLENALSKRTAISLSGSDVTLSTANFADDQARALTLALSGTLTANVNVIVPALSHLYLVEDNTTGSFTVTIKTPAGTGVTSVQGSTSVVYCNGTNVVSPRAATADASTLGGLSASQFARLAEFNQFTKGSGHSFVTIADGGTVTADCTASDRHIVTLGGNRTLALSSPADGQTLEIWVVQDATGGRSLTFPSNVEFAAGIAPALSSVGGAIDVLLLTYNQSLDTWVCRTSSAGSVSATLTGNETNVRIFERVGSPAGVSTVNVLVPTGVRIMSGGTADPALDLSGFASGSTINLVNYGYIIGKGGRGGDGAVWFGLGDDFGQGGRDGEAGGTAVLGPGSGITLNIYNVDGRIWGGGGGGGGGGATGNTASTAAGGGGGGGAGQGIGGAGGRTFDTDEGTANATNGTTGSLSVNGTGGTGAQQGSGGSGGAGGAGGDFGEAGTAGTSPTTGAFDVAGGAGGAAGKAVDLNGGSANFVSGSSDPNVKGAVS